MHGFKSLMQMPVFNNPSQSSNNVRLKIEVHRQVGIVPVTHNAHSFKIFSLLIYLPGSISPASLTELRS